MGWREILDCAPEVDVRNDVRYRTIPTGRALNPVRELPDEVRARFEAAPIRSPPPAGAEAPASGLPFELTLNPYLNCEVGCVYCVVCRIR